jgi:hypothetical protein
MELSTLMAHLELRVSLPTDTSLPRSVAHILGLVAVKFGKTIEGLMDFIAGYIAFAGSVVCQLPSALSHSLSHSLPSGGVRSAHVLQQTIH